MLTKTAKNKHLTALVDIRRRIVGIDTEVPLLDGTKRPYIFFDNAASTPVLRGVLDCINDFMPWYSSVHRGSGFKSQIATHAYEEARRIVGEFFGANKNDHVVIFGKNTTEAINKLSYRLELTKNDVVLISLLEHHSNDLPWRKTAEVHHIQVDERGALIEEDLDRLLHKYRGRVKLVAITGGSNVTGYLPDIHSIAIKAHAAGAQILVDCAQLAPHRAINMRRLSDPTHLDYITVSAHKLYAPFGTGALIGRRDTFETGVPELCGGGTIDVVTTDRVEWTAPPDRDEAGTPNVVGAVAMAKSLTVLKSITFAEIAAHETRLTKYALEKLGRIREITILGDPNPNRAAERLGVIPFKIEGQRDGLVAAILSVEYGIGVRNGCFCAHPYVTRLLGVSDEGLEKFRDEVLAGDRRHMPGVVRASFGVYNTTAEVDRLVQALTAIAGGQYQGTYRQDKSSGDFYAVGWEPHLEKYFTVH